jgi:flagellin
MALVLNTNYSSLVAQNSLSTSGGQLAASLQQLSSGLRINTAADDAAGYAIVQGMTSQIGGLAVAARNANDGVSLTQTAQGALTEITNDLQTMRNLAVQSLNATNSAQDRADLNQQFSQLSQDIDQVAKTASFNGVNLLDGTFQGSNFQIGPNAGQTIAVTSVASARTSALGQTYTATASSAATGATGALVANALVINGVNVGASVSDGISTANSTYSGIAIANAINAAGITGVTATANATSTTAGAVVAAGSLASGDLQINGVNIVGSVTVVGDAVTAINQQTALTGVVASNSGGKIALTAADGRNIAVTTTANGATVSGFSSATVEGNVTLTSTASDQAAAGINIASVGTSGFTVANTTASLNSGTVGSANVLTVNSSTQALYTIDAALQSIVATGAQLGAYQNRFQAAIQGLQTSSTNLQSARSGIQDTDYAAATAQLSKAQILQQASTAMVAQANTIPQNILTLLQKLP